MTTAVTLPPTDVQATCLDTEAMRRHLQPLLSAAAGRPVQITGLRIDAVRRTTSQRRNPHPMTLRYTLDLAGSSQSQRFHARCHRPGASAAAAQVAPAALHLPALDLLLWPWPADPGLPQLPALLDAGQTTPWWGRPADAVQVLHHLPEQRATLRYSRADGGAPLVAKTFHDDRGLQLLHRFQHFWQQAQADTSAPLVAQPLGYDAATRSLWQAAAPGAPLRAGVAGMAEALADAWLAVHRAPHALADGACHDRTHWLAEAGRRQRKLARALPALATSAQETVDALTNTAACLDGAPRVLLHGDAHPGQLWLLGTRPVLFDFDEFTLGDPMEDLAACIARLGALDADGQLQAALLARYAQGAPDLFNARRLRWHAALQQLLQASRSFVYQVPGWPTLAAGHLQQALALACRQEGSP